MIGKYFKNIFVGSSKIFSSMKATLPYLIGSSENYREATEEYPDRVSARMPEDLPARFRGLLNNDIKACSGCRYCAEACPVDCIRIETEPGPERNVSWVAVFDIDHSRCMFCGMCVEVCPTSSLKHTHEYQGSVFRSEDMVLGFGKGWATREMKERWLKEQAASDARVEELALYEKSPVGAELKRRQKQKEERE